MPAYLKELKGSGDFTRGAGTIKGQGLGIVFDAASHEEAESLALAYFGDPAYGVPRSDWTVTDRGGNIYDVVVNYESRVPTANDPAAGEPPASTRPEPPGGGGGGGNASALSRDLTFSTGGATRRMLYSIQTRHKLSAVPAEPAPDFGNLIGVTKDGKVEGCEVIAPSADFTITKRFPTLTLGWFRNMLDLIACTNSADWLGMYAGEVL